MAHIEYHEGRFRFKVCLGTKDLWSEWTPYKSIAVLSVPTRRGKPRLYFAGSDYWYGNPWANQVHIAKPVQ